MNIPAPPTEWFVWGPLGVFFFMVMAGFGWGFWVLVGSRNNPGIIGRAGETFITHVKHLDEVLIKISPAVDSLKSGLESMVAWQSEVELAGEHFVLAMSYQLRARSEVIKAQARQLKVTTYLLSRHEGVVPPDFQEEMDTAQKELVRATESIHKAEALLIRTGSRGSKQDVQIDDSNY